MVLAFNTAQIKFVQNHKSAENAFGGEHYRREKYSAYDGVVSGEVNLMVIPSSGVETWCVSDGNG